MKNRRIGIAFSYGYTVINMVCGLFLSSFLLRILGDTEYGIYQTIASFANYLVLLEFGTGTVMTRNISTCRGRNASQQEINQNVSTIWTLTNFLSGVILLISVLFYFLIGRIYSASLLPEQITYAKKIFIFVTIYLVVSFYCQTLNGIILAFEHYSFSSIQGITRTLIRTVTLIFLIYSYRYALLIAVVDMALSLVLFSSSLIYCLLKLKVNFRISLFSHSILRNSIPLCTAIFLQAIANQANNNVDKFLIGIRLSPESVALYSIALYIFSIFSSLTTIPISLYAPQISKEMSRGIEKKTLINHLIYPCRLVAVVGGMIIFGFISAGKQFICLLYGQSYLQAWPIAIILMFPMYLNMVNGVLINVLDFLNKRMIRSEILTVTTIANIVLTLFWLNRWGIIGAALATAVCTTLGQVIVMNIYYAKAMKIPVLYMYRQAFQGILPFLAVGAAAAFCVGNFIQGNAFSFVICGCIFLLISLVGIAFWGTTKQEKAAIQKILYRGCSDD